MAAPRRRRPVHAPERFALLVVTNRMEVEAGRPAEEQAPALEGAGAGVREERVEVDEARVDEDGVARWQRDLDLLETEGVFEEGLRRLDRIAAARNRIEDVPAP